MRLRETGTLHLHLDSIAGMVSWEISRHPDWDKMFLDGATAKEIAVHFQANIATVHAHLKKREKYIPDFFDLHQKSLIKRQENECSIKWNSHLGEVDDFFATWNRLPSTNGSDAEKVLFRWLTTQRHHLADGELSSHQVKQLEKRRWHSLFVQTSHDQNWHAQFEQLLLFVKKNNRYPKYRNYKSQIERTLGVWLHNQHQSRNVGKLKESRLNILNSSLPDWRSHG